MPEDPIAKFQASLTKEDTVTVLGMCDAAMDLLQKQEYDSLFANLYEYEELGGTIKPLSEETIARYKSRYRLFPVKSYSRAYYGFLHAACNNVKYNVVFATAEQTGGAPATTSFMFVPVKIDGQWFLCLNTAKAVTNKDLYKNR